MYDNKIDSNIAYLIGVLHSDGCLYTFRDKIGRRDILRLNLTIAPKSLPMAIKFKDILSNYFGRTVNIRKVPKNNLYKIQTSINRLRTTFQYYNKDIPKEICLDRKLFYAYLGGLIDGDGHIKIKNNKDRIIPQCMVRISSDHKLTEVKRLVEKYLNCKVHFEYKKNSKGTDTCFYISSKNIDIFKKNVYPQITLNHKIERLESFYNLKMSLQGFEFQCCENNSEHP